MNNIEIQTIERAKEEAHEHSCEAEEILLTDELIEQLKAGKVIYLDVGDHPVFITLKLFL